MKNRKTIRRINKTKSWLYIKINNFDESSTRLTKEKRTMT